MNLVPPDHAAVGELDVVYPWPRLCLHGACPVPQFGSQVLDPYPLVDGQGRELPGLALVVSSNFLVSLGGMWLTLLGIRLPLCLKGAWIGMDTTVK